MITPDYLNNIMYAVEDSLLDVDNYLIRRIAKRVYDSFRNGQGNLFIPATIHDMRKLMNMGVLYEDIQRAVISALPGIEQEVRRAFIQSASEITRQNMDFAEAIVRTQGFIVNVPRYEQVGIDATAEMLQLTPTEIRKLEAAYRRTRGTIHNLTRTTAGMAQQTYIEACDRAYWKAQSGVSIQTAVIEGIQEATRNGVSVVSYGSKHENIEVAIARAVRTGVNQANGDITLTRLAEMGVNYVKTSWHMGARVTKNNDYTNHSYWQGRVYRVDWNNPAFDSFMTEAELREEGFDWLNSIRAQMQGRPDPYANMYPDFYQECRYGDIQGICGANCRHSFYPYYPGINIDDDDRPNLAQNERQYKMQQNLRRMERDIRQAKRELEAVKACKNDTDEWKALHKKAKGKLHRLSDKYMDYCKSTGLKPRNMALKIQ